MNAVAVAMILLSLSMSMMSSDTGVGCADDISGSLEKEEFASDSSKLPHSAPSRSFLSREREHATD